MKKMMILGFATIFLVFTFLISGSVVEAKKPINPCEFNEPSYCNDTPWLPLP